MTAIAVTFIPPVILTAAPSLEAQKSIHVNAEPSRRQQSNGCAAKKDGQPEETPGEHDEESTTASPSRSTARQSGATTPLQLTLWAFALEQIPIRSSLLGSAHMQRPDVWTSAPLCPAFFE